MHITVIGAGYVGLVTAAGLAELGHTVTCADIDPDRIATLKGGQIPIYEPGLQPLIQSNLARGRLAFTTDLDEAVAGAPVTFCGVCTPEGRGGAADLSAVLSVCERVRAQAPPGAVLVLKSTVPVGTHERMTRRLSDRAEPIFAVSNPEFLKEGTAVHDFFHPDRIVIGVRGEDLPARDRMAEVYAPLADAGHPVLWMDPQSAEITKYVANTMLAMRISFMNEIAALCEKVGADVHRVREGVGSDRRIGPQFLYASCGYGGSCFPKDVQALVATAREHGVDLTLARATHEANERQKGLLLSKVAARFDGDLDGRRVAIWGAAFKPRTDDIRNSPAVRLIQGLLGAGAEVAVHDPAANASVRRAFGPQVQTFECPYECARGADALVLCTEWKEYHRPDFKRLGSVLQRQLLIDGRNIWSSLRLRDLGFLYEGIGVRT